MPTKETEKKGSVGRKKSVQYLGDMRRDDIKKRRELAVSILLLMDLVTWKSPVTSESFGGQSLSLRENQEEELKILHIDNSF